MLITCNSPSNDADSATDSDGAAETDATAGEEEPSSLRFGLKQQWQKDPTFCYFFCYRNLKHTDIGQKKL